MTEAEEYELQNKIEQKQLVNPTVDAKAYHHVYKALSKEPFELSYGFADTVVRRIEIKNKKLSADYAWLGAGIFVFFVTAIITAVSLKFTLKFGAFTFVSGYVWLFVFGITMMLLFHWLDKKVVYKKLGI